MDTSKPYSPTDDQYGFRQLSYHLFQAGLSDELYRLVLNKGWYQQSTGFDPSGRQYREDIQRAFQATVGQIKTNLHLGHEATLGTLLARPAALAWLSASFGQAARLISIQVLEAMTRLGDVEQATRRAEMMPDPVRRAEALTQIGEAAFTLGQHSQARERWNWALELLLGTPTDFFNEKLEALGQLTRTLARNGQEGEASSVAGRLRDEVADEVEQSGGVTSTAHIALAGAWGAVGEKGKALAAVQELTEARDRITALCAAANGLLNQDRAQATDVLDTAMKLARQVVERTALSRLAQLLAEAGRLSDAWQITGEEIAADRRSRILLAAARGALRQGDPVTGEQLLTEAFQEALTVEPEKERLLLLAELASAAHLVVITNDFARLLGHIKEHWKEFETEMDSRALGTVALGLLALGDVQEAQEAVSSALDWKLPTDDWEENEALGELAEALGETGDSEGLTWILARAEERQRAWPQAELAYRVGKACRAAGDTFQAAEAEELMRAAALAKTGSLPQASARGILAVWQAERKDPTLSMTARELIDQTLVDLEGSDDAADALAHLALTLVHGEAKGLARYVLRRAITVIQRETDPNTLARAIGTAAEGATALEETDTLRALKVIAEKIDDEWLQAEALFWVAGWQAILGHYDEARQTYLEAAVSGVWQPIDPADVQTVWKEGSVDRVVEIAQDVGWPSTTAAALFAGLALVLEKPGVGWIEDGLLAIDQITEGYNHIRAVCHHLLLNAATRLPGQPAALIRGWVTALEHHRGRDAGEVWAVIEAGIPLLYAQFGESFVGPLWQELAAARDLLSG